MPTRKVLSESISEKKPSLASLMPDKAKTATARRKAVKKIEAHVSKKADTKSAKSAKIVVDKKVTATGLGVKRVSKKRVSKDNTTLVLPSNMSIRAREKVLVILEYVSDDFAKSAERIAYVSGLCFILLGASMSLAFSDGIFSREGQTANVASTTTTTTSGTTISQQTTIPRPEISLLDPLPVEATQITEHKLAVVNGKNIYVKAKSLGTGSIVVFPTSSLSGELYRFTIDGQKLNPGRYDLRAYVESTIGNTLHEFPLGSFYVPQRTIASATSSSTDTTTTTSATDAQDVSDDETDTEEDLVDTTTEDITTTSSTTPPTTTASGPALRVITSSGDLSGDRLIKVEAPQDLPFIELYARQPKSTTNRFLGLAHKYPDYWRFYFNTLQIPNGEYELTARTRVAGKDYYSGGVSVRIANYTAVKTTDSEPTDPVANTTIAPITNNTDSESETEPEDDEPVVNTSARSLPEFSITNVEESEETQTPVTLEITDVLARYESRIRELLNRYAVAKQSGDVLLLDIATKEIMAGKRRIIEEILADRSINLLADEAEKILNERFSILQKRVDTFEELRRTASNDESSADTDSDGISDFDEKTLYNTDPAIPDSDNDGIQDGIEIMKGFNPTDASPEAIIAYELPQESLGLVQEEVLTVDTVSPVIIHAEGDVPELVQAEIRGKALPNSYVTLYIFSTPTIVTVRTDKDGSFVYTFDKELEDGEHEVYVAVTDNTGAIMARSNPFRFVKEAQAFTPVDANATEPVASESFTDQKTLNSYNIVVGLGVLAFGLILLMLGVGMRERGAPKLQEPAHDLKTS